MNCSRAGGGAFMFTVHPPLTRPLTEPLWLLPTSPPGTWTHHHPSLCGAGGRLSSCLITNWWTDQYLLDQNWSFTHSQWGVLITHWLYWLCPQDYTDALISNYYVSFTFYLHKQTFCSYCSSSCVLTASLFVFQLWPPVQIANFYFIPLHHRFVNVSDRSIIHQSLCQVQRT